MAITAQTLGNGSLAAAASLLGGYPTPPTFKGWLNGTSTSYPTGSVLVNGAGPTGQFAISATDIAGTSQFGVLCPMAPRRQDQAPLTSGTAPAAALPGQRTTPAAGGPDFSNPDDPNWVCQYYPFLPGVTFVGHLVNEGGANGTDLRADADADILRTAGYSITRLAGGAADEINYPTKAGLFVLAFGLAANNANARLLQYVNPQPTTVDAAGTLILQPGPVVENDATTGTFQPLMVFVPILSALF